ncbi:MAG: lamin tail domain-containing protein, partial [Planctomycetota bacterium]
PSFVLMLILSSVGAAKAQPGSLDYQAPSTLVAERAAPLAINELMASNRSSIRDPQGQYDDWIEIYNYGTATINVGGMYVTDDMSNPTKWRIPSNNSTATTIRSRGYLLIWADDDTANSGLHANFKLDAGGEEIGLFDKDGVTLIDSIVFPEQTTDISYGRYPDADESRRFFGSPSPGARNGGGYIGEVGDTKFSYNRGFYDKPFYLTIATETDGAVIYYTLDGSEPFDSTVRSSTGIIYTGPIPITTTTTLRAMAFKPGWKPTNVDTHTYIFPEAVLRQATNPPSKAQVIPSGCPASWGSVAGDYQVDPDIVGNSNLDNRLVADDLLSVPTFSLVMPRSDWFGSRGIYINESQDGTERKASLEFMEPSTGDEFQVNCAIAMQGGVSGGGTSLNRWKTAKLSMRPRFKSDLDDGTPTGGPAQLDYQVFRDSPVEQFDTFVFDAVLNHSWLHPGSDQRNTVKYIQDQYVADIHNAMGGHSPHASFAHLYISGLYWGMYYVHERPDHSWAAETFGGNKEEYDAVKHNSGGVINNSAGGNASSSFNAMLSAASAVQSDPTNPAKYEALCQKLDIDDFITYLLANWYGGNHDWPQKNWYATHRNHPDGRWRFHSWDAEHVLEGGNDIGKSPYDIHNKLKGNAEYLMCFADHIQRNFLNGGVLSYPSTANMYRERMTEIDRAIVGESARWGDNRQSNPYTRKNWLDVQNNMLSSFFPGRSTTVLGWLKSARLYPNIDAPVFRINGSYKHGGAVAKGSRFSMTAATSEIRYTLDGSDPRAPGTTRSPAGVSPNALRYTSPITLPHSAHVKARILNGSTWSALNEAVFAVGPVAENLRITEIMYHPKTRANADEPNEEFIELKNIGAESINLNLVSFTDGIDFTFPNIELAPGEYVLVVQDLTAFEGRYGSNLNVAGQYSGSLNNAGEKISLQDAIGQTILDFNYKDGWRSITDGEGFS